MKIRKKIILPIIIVNVMLILSGYFINRNIIQNKIILQYKDIVDQKSETMVSIMEDKKANAGNVVGWFENSARLIKSLKESNRDMMVNLGKEAMKNFSLDYWVVTDKKGNVIARAQEPEKFGDSIANQVNIQKALKGEKSVGIENGTDGKPSILAGCPIIDENGNLIGAVSIGYLFSSDVFADKISKILDSEVTIFNGLERVGTTLKDGDKRLTGTKLENEEVEDTVLKKGNKLSGTVVIFNKQYYSVYTPIFDVNNKIVGLYFVGEPISIIKPLVSSLTIFQLISSIIVMIISILVLSLVLRKSLSVPLKKLGIFFKELAAGEGDLTKTMDISTKDEVGEAMEEFNKFILKLREIILHVKKSSEIVTKQTSELKQSIFVSAESMAQISNSIVDISNSLEENAAAVGQTASSAQEMYKVSDMVANSCINVSEQSLSSNELVINGNQNVKEVVYSIENIANSSQEVMKKMNLLQELSSNINEIVTIITDISSKTNLLSLNASIEAARAGKNGKSFAVVAEEVRKLAAESAKSASEITTLIHTVQEYIDEASLKVNKVSENVSLGVINASKVSKSFEEIAKAIKIVSDKAHDIAAATEQQSAATSEISGSMDELEKVINNIAGNSHKMNISIQHEKDSIESIKLSTSNISETVENMNSMVEKFKV